MRRSPNNAKGRPGRHPSPANSQITTQQLAPRETKNQSNRNRRPKVPVVEAIRFRMFGRPDFDQLIVRRCPLCEFAHRHVAFERNTDLFERHPSCRPSATYLVQVVETVPSRSARIPKPRTGTAPLFTTDTARSA